MRGSVSHLGSKAYFRPLKAASVTLSYFRYRRCLIATPSAPFRKRATEAVLPSIRKTGHILRTDPVTSVVISRKRMIRGNDSSAEYELGAAKRRREDLSTDYAIVQAVMVKANAEPAPVVSVEPVKRG